MERKLNGIAKCGIMPEHAPAYPSTWTCPEAHTIIITVEGEEEGIRSILEYTPFEYVSNLFQIWIADLKGHSLAPETNGYKEAAITIPARYGDHCGGYSPWMYCSSVAAVMSGREILGYNKQLADIEFIETDVSAAANVKRNGKELMRVGFAFDQRAAMNPDEEQIKELQKINVNRLLYRTFPKCNEYCAEMGQVIFRDSARKTGERYEGLGSVVLNGTDHDPLDILKIKRILGATFTKSTYGGGLEAEHRTILAQW